MLDRKVIKNDKLMIMDHIGVYYATLDRERMWELDRIVFEILKLCDGNNTVKDIIKNFSERSSMPEQQLEKALVPMFEEMEVMKFISFE